MPSHGRVHRGVRFDRNAELPDERPIETVVDGVVAEQDPPTVIVQRERYRASAALEDAVNLALALGRPLLLQGHPGAGKTRLAHAVAYALGRPLELAVIKSTSLGRDLLYTFEAVRRLYDVQVLSSDGHGPRPQARDYVTLGPLGRAIARAGYGRPSVVLIDEIDKADLDFPNDLLYELDELAFSVAEVPGLRYEVPRGERDLWPLVIVTNNEEKTLPDAFLRRCIFHYVEFPDDEELPEILALHDIDRPDLVEAAVAVLQELRGLDLAKNPGLSELIDWLSYLADTAATPAEVAKLPHAGALIKQHGDQVRVERMLRDR
ncbi:AAA family ATPase [Dactylosporangium sp. CA-139066]|uniref:AAA family ATPase n=1 Tax=Dactylosporangium sp. CA-139066 TaxID=3239930 RepID=UPI003D8E152C